MKKSQKKKLRQLRAKTGTKKQVEQSYNDGRVVYCYNMVAQVYKSKKDYNRQQYKKINSSDY